MINVKELPEHIYIPDDIANRRAKGETPRDVLFKCVDICREEQNDDFLQELARDLIDWDDHVINQTPLKKRKPYSWEEASTQLIHIYCRPVNKLPTFFPKGATPADRRRQHLYIWIYQELSMIIHLIDDGMTYDGQPQEEKER